MTTSQWASVLISNIRPTGERSQTGLIYVFRLGVRCGVRLSPYTVLRETLVLRSVLGPELV